MNAAQTSRLVALLSSTLLLGLLGGCSGDAVQGKAELEVGPGLHVFIGEVKLNEPLSMELPSEFCLEDGRVWRGAAHRMSGVNVVGLEESLYNERHPIGPTLPRPDAGQVVLIQGVLEPDFGSTIRDVGPCTAVYLRQAIPYLDGAPVAGEGGYQTTHAALHTQPWIRAEEVLITHIHEIVEKSDDSVVVRLINPLDVPIRELNAQLHYVPDDTTNPHLPIYDPITVPTLPAGGDATLDLKPHLNRVGVDYTLRHIIIQGTSGVAHFDVRLFLDIAPPKPENNAKDEDAP